MIDKIGAGHYQTREGDDVVILCLDAPAEKPVIGYYVFEGKAYICTWFIAGVYSTDQEGPSSLDLIPIQRKPREVYIERIVFERLRGDYLCHVWVGEKAEDFSNPVLFREVMEDEE